MMMRSGDFLMGTISGLQNNREGKPTWIVSGMWKASLPSKVNSTFAVPTLGNNTGSNTPATSSGKFASMFNMVMINGSEMQVIPKHLEQEIKNIFDWYIRAACVNTAQ